MQRQLPTLLLGVAIFCLARPAPAQNARASVLPRIVNGTITATRPETGVLLELIPGTGAPPLCSGALIGCHTFLTAAHCVCADAADDAASCLRLGPTPPESLRVFLQRAGFFAVAGVVVHPDYQFGVDADLAIVKLATAAGGIAPIPPNDVVRPPFGTRATIAGFGRTGGPPQTNADAGIKRIGVVTTERCAAGVPDATNVCWTFKGEGSNTCQGDSGGPLFFDPQDGGGLVLAGITSGGDSASCLSPDNSNDTDIFGHYDWIASTAGEELGGGNCTLFQGALAEPIGVVEAGGVLSDSLSEVPYELEIPADTALLRVALNGDLVGGRRFLPNDFDLFVRFGAPPTTTDYDCRDTGAGVFGFCELSSPTPGPWYVLVRRFAGSGRFQMTATRYAATPVGCTGDCDGDGMVSVDEILRGVGIALGDLELAVCPAFDRSGDGMVTVDEITAAVGNALEGCR